MVNFYEQCYDTWTLYRMHMALVDYSWKEKKGRKAIKFGNT